MALFGSDSRRRKKEEKGQSCSSEICLNKRKEQPTARKRPRWTKDIGTAIAHIDVWIHVFDYFDVSTLFQFELVSTTSFNQIQKYREKAMLTLRIRNFFFSNFEERLWTVFSRNKVCLTGSFLTQCLTNTFWQSKITIWCFGNSMYQKTLLDLKSFGLLRSSRSTLPSWMRSWVAQGGGYTIRTKNQNHRQRIHVVQIKIHREYRITSKFTKLNLLTMLVSNLDFRFLQNFCFWSQNTCHLQLLEKSSLRNKASAREFSSHSCSLDIIQEHNCTDRVCAICPAKEYSQSVPPSCLLLPIWSIESSWVRIEKYRKRGFHLLEPISSTHESKILQTDHIELIYVFKRDSFRYAKERFVTRSPFQSVWHFYLKR